MNENKLIFLETLSSKEHGFRSYFNKKNNEYFIFDKIGNKIFGVEDTVFLSLAGSRLFGGFTEKSDYDIFGIYIPKTSDTILNKDKKWIHEQLLDTKVIDINFVDVYTFLRYLFKTTINCFEILFAKNEIEGINDDSFKLVKNYYLFFIDKSFKPFFGFLYHYINNENNDEKQIKNLKRVYVELKQLITERKITYPNFELVSVVKNISREDIDRLKDEVKNNFYPSFNRLKEERENSVDAAILTIFDEKYLRENSDGKF